MLKRDNSSTASCMGWENILWWTNKFRRNQSLANNHDILGRMLLFSRFLIEIPNGHYVPVTALFAIAGLIIYRLDKSHRPTGESAHGFTIRAEISIIVALVILIMVIVHPLPRTYSMKLFLSSNLEALEFSLALEICASS